MNVIESIQVALDGLFANKLRSALTMLGIIIGITAVIALVSMGQGVQKMVTEQIQDIGSNVLFVLPFNIAEQGRPGRTRWFGTSVASSLTIEDAKAIADPFNVPDVTMVAAEFTSQGQAVYGNNSTITTISGVTPEYEEARNFHVVLGNFVGLDDLNRRATVCVLGQTVVERLFPEGVNPIGQTIKINRVPFRVLGIMEEKGGSGFGGDEDDVILVPLTTAQTRLFRQRSLSGDYSLSVIYARVTAEDRMNTATADITELLRQRHGIIYRDEDDDFTVMNQADVVSVFGDIARVLTVFLGAIATISLLVGGIGIMNIMLVSVTERTREIGIRKAVGAKRRDILIQFLIEAVVLSIIGGVVGILLGAVASNVVSVFSEDLKSVVSLDTILLAAGFSGVVGLFFGIYPAARAASLNPIDALRYE